METTVILPGRSVRLSDGPTAPSSCERCGDERWLLVFVDGAQKLAPCTCQRARLIEHRIPKKYADARLTDFLPATLKIVGDFLEDRNSPGLLISGAPGVGKTHLAVAICRALLEAGQDVKLKSAATFYRELREGFNSERSEGVILSEYSSAPWLLLDDLGSGALSDFERRYLLELLDGRQDRRTIITSNFSVEEIRERLDERISSRLAEFAAISCNGRDRRNRGAM